MPEAPAESIAAAVHRVVEAYRESRRKGERREKGRTDLVLPAEVRTESGEAFTVLTRDISETGLRLISTRRLLGQRLVVHLPRDGGHEELHVRILWACSVGTDLVENGGTFLPPA
jgi:hypothetical protein